MLIRVHYVDMPVFSSFLTFPAGLLRTCLQGESHRMNFSEKEADLCRAGHAVRAAAGREVPSHDPTVSADPEGVAARADNRLPAAKETHELNGWADRRLQHRLVGQGHDAEYVRRQIEPQRPF